MIRPIKIASCPKSPTSELGKARDPAETVVAMKALLTERGRGILAETRRIDQGRLGIPVYMSVCGRNAREIMPTRKQMGKGATPSQAEASALMELVERHAFFSFWQDPPGAARASWSEAGKKFGPALVPLKEMLLSVGDDISEGEAGAILDRLEWLFYPATRLDDGRTVWLPLDWFRMLGEFNGSAAGNNMTEALLQGLSELVERHVSAIASREHPVLPTISRDSITNPVLLKLLGAFSSNGVNLLLKDMTLGMPLPTIAAFAWDPATFPDRSELVFTAGTAASPEQAAIRAITEVAQLGGDFCSGSVYEASGLEKYAELAEAQWLQAGPEISLATLPDISSPDLADEVLGATKGLAPLTVYAIETPSPGPGAAACWCVCPGLQFRERDRNASIGLFAGRRMAEELAPEEAATGLLTIQGIYGRRHFLPFFEGILALRKDEIQHALEFFDESLELAPDAESAAMAAFYAGHSERLRENWEEARSWLERALTLDPAMKEAVNLLGICHYKNGNYAEAESCFDRALKLDRGSAMDLANRGVCRKLLGRHSEAAEDLAAALELDPSLEFAARHLRELEKK